MGSTKNNRIAGTRMMFFLVLFFAGSGLIQARDQLGTEILSLEQRLAFGAISIAERYDALVQLARLRQLSGNLAGAAANWISAAEANQRDDTSLIAAAYCLAAIGEWERAESIIRPLLNSALQGPSMLQARYLDAFLKVRSSANTIKDGASGVDAAALVALANDSAFAPLHPTIYYSLWQIMIEGNTASEKNRAESWKARLIAEFPKSPEARIAAAEKNALPVKSIQSPLWLLFPGEGNVSFTETVPSPPEPRPAQNTGNTAAAVILQTGLFSRESNARNQAEALRKAGFSATASPRLVNGAEHWVVTVPAGQNTNTTIQALKKAGFDSFPVK